MTKETPKLLFRNSIRFKLIVGILSTTLPLILMLIIYNFYAIHVVRSQVADSYGNMITLYMKQIDNNLQNIDYYIANVVALDSDFIAMEQASSIQSYEFSKILLANTLKKDILLYRPINSFFVYSAEKNDLLDIYHNINMPAFSERNHVNDYIREMLSSTEYQGYYINQWKTHEINHKYYVLHIVKSGSLFFGAWVKADHLMIPLNLIDIDPRGGALFVTDQGIAMTNHERLDGNEIDLHDVNMNDYSLSKGANQYLIVGERSEYGDFNLVAMIPDDKILEKLPYLQRIIWLIIIVSIVILPLGLYHMRKTILIPLNRLISGMKRIQTGHLDYQIQEYSASTEFEIVNRTFNRMSSRIHELTVHVYEEKLHKQQEELQRLRLQINPHFYMNALNIIYSLAKTQQFQLIQEMSLSLVHYFRYILKSNMTFVQLKEEIKHTRIYARIQEMRFPGSFTCNIQIPDFLEEFRVPPLILQTFVENTIKHGMTLDEPIHILIDIDLVEIKSAPYINIKIEDTGKGFSDETLDKLQRGEPLKNDQSEHIGIWNVQRRLRLLYSNQAVISFSNRTPSGAVIELTLPMHPMK